MTTSVSEASVNSCSAGTGDSVQEIQFSSMIWRLVRQVKILRDKILQLKVNVTPVILFSEVNKVISLSPAKVEANGLAFTETPCDGQRMIPYPNRNLSATKWCLLKEVKEGEVTHACLLFVHVVSPSLKTQ